MSAFERSATTHWKGGLMDGTGEAVAATGAFTLPVTFPSRIQDPAGRTSPEELMAAAHAATPSRPSPAPVIALVPREPPPDYWIATIVPDAGATATQVVRAVIAGRQLLGVSAVGVMPSQARRGDWVCFYVPGSGVVGHARLRGQADRASQLRDGRRFAAIYAIDGVQLYPRPNALDLTSPLQRLATRTPPDPAGPFLSQIEEADFRMLTSTSDARRHAERTPDA